VGPVGRTTRSDTLFSAYGDSDGNGRGMWNWHLENRYQVLFLRTEYILIMHTFALQQVAV